MDIIYGVVTKVNYYDEAKSFGIVKLRIDFNDKEMAKYRNILFTNTFSVLSVFDRKPLIEEEYKFSGEFETTSFGPQFKAKTFEHINEDSKEGIIAYLSSDNFPGVGKATALKIYNKLGNKCLDMIVNDKNVLNGLGIKASLKDIIYDNLVYNTNSKKVIVELLNLGLTMHMATTIFKNLGKNALEKIKADPYILMYKVEGIGFIRADNIASLVGIKKDAPVRLKALINYCLVKYGANTGNTFIDEVTLYSECLKFLEKDADILSKDDFADYLNDLKNESKIVIDSDNLIYVVKTYNDEYNIARRIYKLLQNNKSEFKVEKIDYALEEIMRVNKITYTDKQKEAIKKALIEPIIIITGGPGTGKSTIIKGIIDMYSNMFKNSDAASDMIGLVAPTGRAAKRLKELTLHDASTIHKLLGYEGGERYMYSAENKLDIKMLIVDEFSMVDADLACRLFSSINDDCKVVIVGDADQLPSVACGNVLLDLINTKEITTIKLEHIHRQAANSSIVELAHSVNKGALPYDVATLKHDRNFLICDDNHIIPFIIKTVANALDKGMNLVKDIQVLVPMYRGSIGIEAINHELQSHFNPGGKEYLHLGKRFRVGDKVIQLVNRSEKNIMNGDIGYINDILIDGDKLIKLTVTYDIGDVEYGSDELDEIMLAYAISIHKSQGSEFPLVIVPFSFKYYIMLKRKLIYTAITRAKKYLIMMGNVEAMRKGIVEIEDDRKTKLTSRIKEIINDPSKIKSSDLIVDSSEEDDIEEVSPFDFL
ncbi:MAG: ATP-dependent RecD-like DNA helicase [Bacilli bacterium]|nr:ATP-dependent RecD-like DNA helicase [Bacilli bacterium]